MNEVQEYLHSEGWSREVAGMVEKWTSTQNINEHSWSIQWCWGSITAECKDCHTAITMMGKAETIDEVREFLTSLKDPIIDFKSGFYKH